MFGLGVAGWALAGSPDLSGYPAARTDSLWPSPGAAAGQANWDDLKGRLQGRVALPGDADFGSAKQIFNTRFDAETPAAVVQVASVDDVAAAIVFAAENSLTVAARSGGHSYAGVSSATNAMVIDLRQLGGVSYQDGEAVVGPGQTLYDVYNALDQFGQSIPTGMCPDVGIAGLALGGGIGFESRRYGVTCDRIAAATMVLPDGTVTDVSPTSRPDLYWAIRGGGPLFGVVTSFTLRTCPADSKDVVRLTFPGDHVAQVIAGWAAWLPTADRSQWADVSVDADGHGGLSCWVQLVCDAGAGPGAAADFAAATMTPLTVETNTLSHMDTVSVLAGGSPTQPRASFTNGSDVVTEMSPEVIGAIIQALTTFSAAGGTGWVQINTLDGAVRDTGPGDTAFPWRTHAALVEWGAYQPIPHETALAWVTAAHRLIQPESVGAYVNYLEPGDLLARYYGPNYPRLDEIRRSVDPDGRIHTVLVN
ncbi:FAD-binding oxidoreductase [Nocardia sp. NBC_01499]|uniref:FAD-dependent oxidoreductase n=1 Tax=Nocardia sp. NBC_01499 TaxID=2903597 RepID=UPI00386D5C71